MHAPCAYAACACERAAAWQALDVSLDEKRRGASSRSRRGPPRGVRPGGGTHSCCIRQAYRLEIRWHRGMILRQPGGRHAPARAGRVWVWVWLCDQKAGGRGPPLGTVIARAIELLLVHTCHNRQACSITSSLDSREVQARLYSVSYLQLASCELRLYSCPIG